LIDFWLNTVLSEHFGVFVVKCLTKQLTSHCHLSVYVDTRVYRNLVNYFWLFWLKHFQFIHSLTGTIFSSGYTCQLIDNLWHYWRIDCCVLLLTILCTMYNFM